MNSNDNVVKTYFGVMARWETYLNTLFLFLAFPLGLTYFVLLTVGFSSGTFFNNYLGWITNPGNIISSGMGINRF